MRNIYELWYNMWLVMLNHIRSWFVCWFVWDPSWFHWTIRFIWAQVWRFDRFGDCYYTCALINWTVLLHWSFMARICLRKGRISSSSVAFSVSLSQRLLGTYTVLLCTSRGATCSPHKTTWPASSLQNPPGYSGHTRYSSPCGIEYRHPPNHLDLWRLGVVSVWKK